MSERVSISISEGVADVRLTRADKMNALDRTMFDAIIEAIASLEKRADLRAVVLSGEGRAFCAGLDMGSFAAMAGGRKDGEGVSGALLERAFGEANRAQQVAWGWRQLAVPVIAAVHGVAFGGGFQIALGADIRIAAPDTKMSIMEIKWGLVPDMAGTQIMRHLAREDVVRELTYTGRVFTAAEGQGFGFVTRLADDPHAEALALAREIAGKSPHAVRSAKRLLNAATRLSPPEGLVMESQEQAALIGTRNQIESVMANVEKRAPKFADPG